jgi:hypothetical protein
MISPRIIEHAGWNGVPLRVEFLGEALVRIRMIPSGVAPETGLNRYGFIRPPAAADLPVRLRRTRPGSSRARRA